MATPAPSRSAWVKRDESQGQQRNCRSGYWYPRKRTGAAVSLKLRDALENYGIEVVMTRTTQNVDISNIQRAQIANKAGADLFVRIHADGSDESSTRGIHVLYPASVKGWTDDIATASKQAATLAQRELIAATGAKDRGIDAAMT